MRGLVLPKFTEADADRAYEEWTCNCGPGALAAIAGLTLDEVHPLIPNFDAKRYTSPTMMYAALEKSGKQWDKHCPKTWPKHGLVRIQFEGPWMAPGVPARAQYRYTHWVGAHIMIGENGCPDIGVFDINCINNGIGWVSLEDWTKDIVPYLTENIKRATGGWHITHSIEVEP